MSLLLNCQNISKSFGLVPVFSDVSMSINSDDRLGIIGPNGAGKSTLLKIFASQETPDSGILAPKRGLKISYVPQAKEYTGTKTIREILEEASSQNGDYNIGRVESLIGQAKFPDGDAVASALSGGWKKRLSICEEIIGSPELLLIDEPTNHLDLAGIEWLEDLFSTARYAIVVISHDRYFLEAVASRMIEVNRIYPSGTFSIEGGYGKFMELKAQYLEGQASALASASNKLRMETEWLRRGAPARSTKQQARIKGAAILKDFVNSATERSRRQSVEFAFVSSERKSKRLIELKEISKSYGNNQLFENISFVLSPGMRLGLLGANGSGKSTLIKILQNIEPADTGSVFHADQLKIVYYDQHREDLPNHLTLKTALAPDNDSVVFQGRSLHIVSYIRKFGFKTEQLGTTVERLSGGERARLLIARMLLRPADVLILDEPTNDLDIDTLEILEECLTSFTGAVVLVTHDRYLIDRVCTGMLGILPDSSSQFFADYYQYSMALQTFSKAASKSKSGASQPPAQIESTASANSAAKAIGKIGRKLSYNEQREWDSIEEKILNTETLLQKANEKLSSDEVATNPSKLEDACKVAQDLQAEVDRLYARWSQLEELVKGSR
ncbi:MAG: ABC-F family ATP-binding cassette domain-containing protein [Proteobacteria bacterium]|nr:ABC-F family ATP-binding cassette domain-containing protein [Pseudomonadota bacterium]